MKELFKKWLKEFMLSIVGGIVFLMVVYYTMFIVYLFGGWYA